MPLLIESAAFRPTFPPPRERRIERGTLRDRGRRLRIGLINNMPDSALKATERQFSRLIEDAAGDYDIRLTLVALPSLPRAPEARDAMVETYRDPRQLRLASPDALIFTGAEPRAAELDDEPFWNDLTALMDWARGGVQATLYSCLAAHAAALHRDGVKRRRLIRKLSGVYESEVLTSHELTQGLTRTLSPHSRYNALAECDLEYRGYLILTRSDEAGPDLFVREKDLLEVFWQGHPEYDRDTLAREFRRDMLRYLNGERAHAPHLPENYFDADAQRAISAALENASSADLEAISAALNPATLAPAQAFWRASAERLMNNFLTAVARRKAEGHTQEIRAVRFGG